MSTAVAGGVAVAVITVDAVGCNHCLLLLLLLLMLLMLLLLFCFCCCDDR